MTDNIEVVTLARGTAAEDGPWVSGGGHRVHAEWKYAEWEVKARCLRTLASRKIPPDGVAFVRAWEVAAQLAESSGWDPVTGRPINPDVMTAAAMVDDAHHRGFTPPIAPAVSQTRGRARGR